MFLTIKKVPASHYKCFTKLLSDTESLLTNLLLSPVQPVSSS